MQGLFNDLGGILKNQISTRDTYRQRIKNWDASNSIYTQDEIERRKAAEFPTYSTQTIKNLEQLGSVLADMEKRVIQRENSWEAGNSAKLTNALKVIEVSGPSLNKSMIRAMRQSFMGDLTTLSTLKSILTASLEQYEPEKLQQGAMEEISAFDSMIYDPEQAYGNLLAAAKDAFFHGNGLDRLIRKINQVAGMEGLSPLAISDTSGADHDASVAFGTADADPVVTDEADLETGQGF